MEVLGGFRTPVDALSLADDKSVRIENQEEEEEEENDDEEKRRILMKKRRNKLKWRRKRKSLPE